jgi:hypothetical protein
MRFIYTEWDYYVVCLKRSVNGTRKQKNRRYKQINFMGLQNNRHPSQHTVGNVHKAKVSLGIDRITAVARSWIAATAANRAPLMDRFRRGDRK